MAARNRPSAGRAWTPEVVRARIKTGLLMRRLMDHALGDIEMTPTQIQAATVLLKKVVPDLSASSLTVTKVTKRLTYAERIKHQTGTPADTPAPTVEHTVQ